MICLKYLLLVVVALVDVATVGRLVDVAKKTVIPAFFHTCRGRLCRCSSLGG
jgi:hypothetical protein